jgi:hypothetical protein
MVSREEKCLAHTLFKAKCICASAGNFQSLFWAVKKARHGPAFETVGPQGNLGDGGNDGYLPAESHYFQVYGPLNPKEKASRAAKKLREDFEKVRKQWAINGRSLLKFSYAYNDKYHGTPKEISLALNDLRQAHPGIEFFSYSAADLESDFFELNDSFWDGILSMAVPPPEQIVTIDYSVLGEVIAHILQCDITESDSRLDLPPELDEKIQLNELSATNGVIIKNGALQCGHINTYFSNNAAFLLKDLRNHVVGVYETVKAAANNPVVPAGVSRADLVFKALRISLLPRARTAAMLSAVDAIIGYFFEVCDIFDPKPESRGLPGATP